MRINEPTVLKNDYSWRLGKLQLQLQLRDKGSKWNKSWQLDIGDNYRVLEFSKLNLALSLCHFHDNHHMSLQLFGLWVRLPFRINRQEPNVMSSWGFSAIFGNCGSLHLNWGTKTKVLWWPWDWDHIDAEYKVMLIDESWEQYCPTYKDREAGERQEINRWRAVHPYRYMLKNGEVQHRMATVTVERRAWRRKFLPTWLKVFQKCRTTIEVEFSDEVGERSGGWKGGTIGCGYDMRRGERPYDTLRRMEAERRFV